MPQVTCLTLVPCPVLVRLCCRLRVPQSRSALHTAAADAQPSAPPLPASLNAAGSIVAPGGRAEPPTAMPPAEPPAASALTAGVSPRGPPPGLGDVLMAATVAPLGAAAASAPAARASNATFVLPTGTPAAATSLGGLAAGGGLAVGAPPGLLGLGASGQAPGQLSNEAAGTRTCSAAVRQASYAPLCFMACA